MDDLLKKHVDDKGFVDYKAFKKDHNALNEYLQYLNNNAPTKTTSINEQFAYYINLYNAATVDLILENDMPASIKDISGPLGQVWLVEHVMINDKAYSLAAVEKNVLQKWVILAFTLQSIVLVSPVLNFKTLLLQLQI